MADHIVLMKDGHIMQQAEDRISGRIEEIIARAKGETEVSSEFED